MHPYLRSKIQTLTPIPNPDRFLSSPASSSFSKSPYFSGRNGACMHEEEPQTLLGPAATWRGLRLRVGFRQKKKRSESRDKDGALVLAVDDGRKERERRREKRDDRTRARLSNGISINYKISKSEARGGLMRLIVGGGWVTESSESKGSVVVGVRTLSEASRVGNFSREQVELSV